MAQGTLEQIVPKATKAGKQYLTLKIDGVWGSFWGTIGADAKGATVQYTAEKNGEYTNYSDVSVIAPAASQGGGRVRGAAPKEGPTEEYWENRNIEIRRQSLLRTAAQIMTPFEPKKGGAAMDRLAEIFALADKMDTYVTGGKVDIKTPPKGLPTTPADDSVFPKE